MRIGIAVLPSLPWPELTAQARTVDSAGFDTLMTGDHLRHPVDADFPFLDGWSVLAAWAVVTSRVRLAMLVSNAIYRTPAVLVKQAIAVDHFSAGRLDLGIGSGVFDTDHDMAGVPRWSLEERVGRTDELVVIVDRLLRGVVDDYEGRWYFVRQAAVSPLPVQRPRPPLVVGANHARMLRVAAARADVWNTWGGYGLNAETFVELTERRAAIIDRLCEELGRDPTTLRRSVLVHHSAFDPWRSTDAFRRIVNDMAALQFSECIFYWPRDEERATFDRVATDVLPELRS